MAQALTTRALTTRALTTRALRADTALFRLTRLLQHARVLARHRLRRHDLTRLNAHVLRDIGISRERK
jgi:uncharacterized protein YjiS (DUF1127 family)